MGCFRRVTPLLFGCLLLACGKRAADESAAAAATVAAKAPAKPAESIFDAQGRLKPSAETVEWLQIPQGFRRKPSLDERHLRFDADTLPLDKVRDYLSARTFTSGADEGQARVVYRSAVPLESVPKAVPLDIVVTARPSQRLVVLEIERFSYGDAKPITVDEARRQLAQERAQAE